jgi:hypothetical protein
MITRPKDEIIESHIKKLIDDRPRLDIFEGVYRVFQSSKYAGHTEAMLLGMNEWLIRHPQEPESVMMPMIVVADEKQRFAILDELDKYPALEWVIIITVSQLKTIKKTERVMGWTMEALVRYAHEGHLASQNILMLERARELEW